MARRWCSLYDDLGDSPWWVAAWIVLCRMFRGFQR